MMIDDKTQLRYYSPASVFFDISLSNMGLRYTDCRHAAPCRLHHNQDCHKLHSYSHDMIRLASGLPFALLLSLLCLFLTAFYRTTIYVLFTYFYFYVLLLLSPLSLSSLLSKNLLQKDKATMMTPAVTKVTSSQ